MLIQRPARGTPAARMIFEPSGHTYTLDGRELASVSTVIRPLSPELDQIPRWRLDAAAKLGTWLHESIALDLDGDLDRESVPEEIEPEFAAWESWRKDRERDGWRWLAWERRVCAPELGIAGTLDLLGLDPGGRYAVIDHKRTYVLPTRSVGPQTAGYALCLSTEPGAPSASAFTRYCLHLRDGAARFVALNSPNDERAFLACVTVHHWSKAA